MPTHVKVSGAWKLVNNAYVKVSGAWKQCNQIYPKVSGAFKESLDPTYVLLQSFSRNDDGRVGVQYQTDGDILTQDTVSQTESYSDSGQNWASFLPYDHWIRLTVNSGTTPLGSATGSWLKVNGTSSANRSWYLLGSSNSIVQANITIAIATDNGGANIVASDMFTWTLDDAP